MGGAMFLLAAGVGMGGGAGATSPGGIELCLANTSPKYRVADTSPSYRVADTSPDFRVSEV